MKCTRKFTSYNIYSLLDLTWVFYIDDCNEILIWCVVYSRKTVIELYAQLLLLSRDLIFEIYKYGKFYENENAIVLHITKT